MDSADGPVGSTLLVIVFMALPVVAAGLALLVAGRLDSSRSVLVHAPASHVWGLVRHFPTLHERHGKARDLFQLSRWELRRGDGEAAGSVWRVIGTWEKAPYWADVELVRIEPGRHLAISLQRDTLGTHRGLRGHLGSLTLEPVGPDATKLTWRLRASLRSPRLLLARLMGYSRLQARLFDQGLRSLKVEIDSARREEPPPDVPAEPPESLRLPAPPAQIPPETTV